ncbi:hypothetical protein CapIbe_017901, partial [Capra ibex]
WSAAWAPTWARAVPREAGRGPAAAAAALSPRAWRGACPAAPRAPLLRAGELGIWGDQSRRGQHAERAAAPPPPGALPPGTLSGPQAGLCRTRAREGPRAEPGPPGGAAAAPEAGAAFPPKPRGDGDGSGCSLPRAAPAPRGFVPESRPAAVPARAASLAAPHREGGGPAPSARREAKARGAGAQRPGNLLHPSPWPGQGAKQPLQRAPRLPSTPRAFPLPHALIRPGPGPRGPDRPCPDRRSRREPQPLLQEAGARAWPPFPRSRRASPWGPAPGPAAPAVLSPARGLLLGCPDLTDSGASGRLAARLFPGASQASLSAHKGWAWSRQSGRQASPLQRRRCTLPPQRPATRGSPGLPARVPCPHLPAAGQMLRARGPAPRSSSARPPSPRSPRLRGAPRQRAPRPRPEAPPPAPGRPHPPDPDRGPRAPTPSAAPVARATALRRSGARDLGTRKPDAPGLQARPGKPLHRRHSATRGRLACGRPEIPRQPTRWPPTRATPIAGSRRPYGGAGPEEGPVAAAPLQVTPRGLVWGRGAASQRRWVLGSSAPPRPHLRPENRGSEQPSGSG